MSDVNSNEIDRRIPEDSSYEDHVQMLEASVARLESGDLSLEDAVREYEFGMSIIEQCHNMLEKAELRVTELANRAEQSVSEPIEDY